jgi:5'/3'-nucleotidase SurE
LEAERAAGAPLIPGGGGLTVEIPGDPDLAGAAVTRITGESSAEFPIVQRPNGLYNSQRVPNTQPSGDPTSQGSQFIEGRLAVSPIDGDWTASEAVRLDLERSIEGRFGDGHAPAGAPLQVMLVNEDGAASPGLQPLRDALLAEGHEVVVVAPATDQSGVGTALTLTDFAVQEAAGGYTVAATPSTTVYTALDVLLAGENRPDLIISGVDEGTSLGLQGFTSANAAAAVAGVFNYGIPSISVAVDAGGDGSVAAGEYAAAAGFVAELLAELQGTAPPSGALLPGGTGLKVNLPEHADTARVAVTRADSSTNVRLEAAAGAPGEARIVFGGPVATGDPEGEGNAFAAGNITVTPIDANYGSDDLGAYDRIASLLGVPFGVPGGEVPFLIPATASAAPSDLVLA